MENVNTETEFENSSSSPLAPKKRLKPGYFRVGLVISYDGTDFCGWQRQSGQVTVQGTLEGILSRIFNEPISLMGASRTDAGVHARGQVAHFDSPRDPDTMDLRHALTGLTPPSVVVKEVWRAADDFHAIATSQKKTYKYYILNRRVPSALRHRSTWWIRFPLETGYLNEASSHLLGRHDFRSFQTSGTTVKSTIREILEAKWERESDDSLVFTITGDGFLKQMVRNLVGTMVNMAQNSEPPERMRAILESCDRREAYVTAPPQGLYLCQVYYPEALDNKCRKL